MEHIWLPNIDYFRAVLKFNLTSLIDIMIVALIFYKLMMWIKGTRAVQLIKGLVILLVATSLSSLFNLYTMHWLLKQAMTALVVALPIVFQPELRRALERLGRGQIITHKNLFQSDFDPVKIIAELSRSTTILSKNKVGALMVLERETGLEEYIDTGVKIDGMISAEFLANIFIARTPLHDGAVIIRGNRVAAAACFLPLSENPGLTSGLGTRHRAGLGISEHSDAVAVVVSEETGSISIAVEGTLTRYLDEASLQERLASLLIKKQGKTVYALWSRRQNF